MTTYGYARVSTQDQDLGVQRDALTAAGCSLLYAEKISGKSADRPELKAMLGALQPGDLVIVTRIDRLARSLMDLLNIMKAIGEKGAGFKSLAESWADFSNPVGRMIIGVMGSLAEYERSLILARTDAGRRRAKAEGRRIGGPNPTISAEARTQAAAMVAAGVSMTKAAAACGMSRASVKRITERRLS